MPRIDNISIIAKVYSDCLRIRDNYNPQELINPYRQVLHVNNKKGGIDVYA